MRGKNSTVPVVITPGFLLVMAVGLLLIPLKWLLSWILAAVIHELSHYAALLLCKCRVISIQLDVSGAKIKTEPISNGKECFCALTGPVGGLLLLPLAPYMPSVSVCGFVQSMYNLLPLFPMDGGRVLAGVLRMLFPERLADKLLGCIKCIVLIWIGFVALYAAVKLNLGLLPLIAAGMLFFRNKNSLAMRPRKEYNMNNIS